MKVQQPTKQRFQDKQRRVADTVLVVLVAGHNGSGSGGGEVVQQQQRQQQRARYEKEAAQLADQFRMTHFSWAVLGRRKKLFRCLERDYLAVKCFLLERFLHDLVFESTSPHTIRGFLGVW